MMKKMKSMSEQAAAVRRLVLLSDEDDELHVRQEWDLTFHEMPESDEKFFNSHLKNVQHILILKQIRMQCGHKFKIF